MTKSYLLGMMLAHPTSTMRSGLDKVFGDDWLEPMGALIELGLVVELDRTVGDPHHKNSSRTYHYFAVVSLRPTNNLRRNPIS